MVGLAEKWKGLASDLVSEERWIETIYNSYGSSDKYPDGNDDNDDDFLLDEEE